LHFVLVCVEVMGKEQENIIFTRLFISSKEKDFPALISGLGFFKTFRISSKPTVFPSMAKLSPHLRMYPM